MGSAVASAYTIEDAPAQSKYTIEDAPKKKSSIPYAPGQVSEAGGIPFVVPGPQTAGEMRTSAQDPEAATKIKGGAETIGTMVGGEAIPAIRGLVGAVLRVLGMGAGAGAGNIAGQVATTGKVNPREAGKATAAGAAFGLGSEVLGAGLSELRSSLGRLAYTSEGELSPLAKAITHPTELPETLFRKAIPEPAEQVAARETFAKTKQIAESQEAAANQQRILSNRARIDAARAAREAKASAPKPAPPSPFGNATPTNVPIGTAKLSDLAGQPTPFAQPNVEMVSKFEAPAKSKILGPDAPPLRVEGSYWSFAKPELLKAVMRGDADAITVWRHRFGTLPPNVKYLTGGEGTSGLYRSNK